ncbi:hypothetical protein DFJ43DRAFT_577371 [Lentinula guzmanii]|uniref:Uncharacterized protein n=1 Tax=Lentinula guzmanii TaxID=2804957 RepID=A0AA38MSD4_9AGAR|nr:hypothetical protein DFJ43DRAFT_577371 [Lentinula guzmanii]
MKDSCVNHHIPLNTTVKSRSMSSVHSGDHGSPPVSQQDLKEAMRYELNRQTWEFAVEHLAQALSAKTRKPSALPSKPEQSDTLKNYDLATDKLDLQINNAVHHFAHNKPETLLVESNCPESESSTYRLNLLCLLVCLWVIKRLPSFDRLTVERFGKDVLILYHHEFCACGKLDQA